MSPGCALLKGQLQDQGLGSRRRTGAHPSCPKTELVYKLEVETTSSNRHSVRANPAQGHCKLGNSRTGEGLAASRTASGVAPPLWFPSSPQGVQQGQAHTQGSVGLRLRGHPRRRQEPSQAGKWEQQAPDAGPQRTCPAHRTMLAPCARKGISRQCDPSGVQRLIHSTSPAHLDKP